MGFFGSLLGDAVDAIGGKKTKGWGGRVGGLLPFKTGGAVQKDTKALLHGGEYVLPKGVKPTVAQKKAVRAIKKADKQSKKKK